VFCSNDYLGLGAQPVTVTAPGGSGASSLVVGHGASHEAATRALASWLETETATLFSSASAANIGVLQALGGPKTLIISDAQNHASIVDGCKLSRATIRVVPHLDVPAIEAVLADEGQSFEERWLVTEAYFSMDADSPNLAALRRVCDDHHAGLIVDEAHSLGIFGPKGRGLCADSSVTPDILIGGLGKAVGLQGGFAAGPGVLRNVLWNRARSFVFSTSLSPLLATCIPNRIATVAKADDLRTLLFNNVALLRSRVAPAAGHGPIVPWIVGGDADAVSCATQLAELGFVVTPIRPPSVPEGRARLRITVSAVHDRAQLEAFASAMTRLGEVFHVKPF